MSQDIFKSTIPEPPAVYPAPKEPRAVYHPPEQEKPCHECAHSHWWKEYLECRHQPLPKLISLKLKRVDDMGTCDYWESNND